MPNPSHETVPLKLTFLQTILTEQTGLKARVERAVLMSQARQRAVAAAASQSAAARPAAPSITLKTDFSNFS